MTKCYKCGREANYHSINGMHMCSGCNQLVKFCKCVPLIKHTVKG